MSMPFSVSIIVKILPSWILLAKVSRLLWHCLAEGHLINNLFSKESTYCTPVLNAAQIPLIWKPVFVIYYFLKVHVPPHHLPQKDKYGCRTNYDTLFIFVNATKKKQARYHWYNETTEYSTISQCSIGPYLPLKSSNHYFELTTD